jgi:hypothetical protein
MLNAATSGDNDDDKQKDYLDIPPGTRMSQVVLFYGSGGDEYVHVPIGQMLGYFKFIGNKIGDVMVGASTTQEATVETTEAMQQLAVGLVALVSPARIPSLDIQSGFASVTPLIAKPFMENAINRNFFGTPVYQEHYTGSGPRSELGYATTGEIWKNIAQGLNRVTNGSEAVSGGLDYQPEVYRHIVESYLGGPGQLVKQLAGMDTSEGAAGIPGVSKFVGSSAKYAPRNMYLVNSSVVRQIMERLNKLTPEQQAEQGQRYFLDTDPRIIAAYKDTEAAIDKLSKARKEALSENPPLAEKKRLIDLYLAEQNKYYSAFNYVYRAVKTGQ